MKTRHQYFTTNLKKKRLKLTSSVMTLDLVGTINLQEEAYLGESTSLPVVSSVEIINLQVVVASSVEIIDLPAFSAEIINL